MTHVESARIPQAGHYVLADNPEAVADLIERYTASTNKGEPRRHSKKGNKRMPKHTTGTREEWLAARLDLLKAEEELTQRSDELARQQQELVRIEKDYRFETDEGRLTAAILKPLPCVARLRKQIEAGSRKYRAEEEARIRKQMSLQRCQNLKK